MTATDEERTYSTNSLTVSLRPLSAPSGAIDSAFAGNAGWVSTALGSNAVAHDALLQANGKIVLVGTAGLKIAMARYYPDGALDRSFGGSGTGQVITAVSGSNRFGDVAFGAALAPDGKIVVAGQADFPNVTNRDFLVARYTADGLLDSSFGGDGTVVTANTTRGDYALSVAVQSDGKIVAGGTFDRNGNVDFMALRYNVDGTLDTSFSGDGKQNNDLGGIDDIAYSVLLEPAGKIVAAGASAGDFAVSRNLPTGQLDTSFDTDGLFKVAIESGTKDTARSIVRLPDGKLLVAGHYEFGLKESFAVARIHPNGTLDALFGENGIATTAISYADDFAWA